MEHYELTLETFRGPLDKLLELVEAQKLEITQLNLATVTADFLSYVQKLEQAVEGGGAPPGLLADFLVVASKLILIKSKALLPSLTLTEEEEEDVADLELRLKIYRELKEAQRHLAKGWYPLPLMQAREFLMAHETAFYPPERLTVADLAASLERIVGELERIARPTAHIRSEIINLTKKIEEVLERLTHAPLHFREFREGKGRGELVVLFLAILHLIKTQLVQVEQAGHFGDIVVARRKENT